MKNILWISIIMSSSFCYAIDNVHLPKKVEISQFGIRSCQKEVVGEMHAGFSPVYFSQMESSMREAIQMLSESERAQPVRLMLHERNPIDVHRPEFQGRIINPPLESDVAVGSEHGEGTLSVMASRSEASVWGTRDDVNVKTYLTSERSAKDLLSFLTELKQKSALPVVINVSSATLTLEADNQELHEDIKKVYAFACENNLVINVAAGNGRDIEKNSIPKEFENCVFQTASLDAVGRHSVRSSIGDQLTVSAHSDRYQKALDDRWHGFTSGATPIVSAAIALVKKVWPEMPSATVKQIIELSAERTWAKESRSTVGYGRLNVPKMVVLARLAKNKKTLVIPKQESSALQSLQAALENPTSCEELARTVLKLRAHYFAAQNTEREPIRKMLEETYRKLEVPHLEAIYSPKGEKGFQVKEELAKKLLSFNPRNMKDNEFYKFLDLISGMEWNGYQRNTIKNMLVPLYQENFMVPTQGFGLGKRSVQRDIYLCMNKIFSTEELQALQIKDPKGESK